MEPCQVETRLNVLGLSLKARLVSSTLFLISSRYLLGPTLGFSALRLTASLTISFCSHYLLLGVSIIILINKPHRWSTSIVILCCMLEAWLITKVWEFFLGNLRIFLIKFMNFLTFYSEKNFRFSGVCHVRSLSRQEFVLSGVCLSGVWISGVCISGVCLSGVCLSGVCHGTTYT